MALVRLTFKNAAGKFVSGGVAPDTIKEVGEFEETGETQILIVRHERAQYKTGAGVYYETRTVAESVDEVIDRVNKAEQPRIILNEPTVQMLAPDAPATAPKKIPFQPG